MILFDRTRVRQRKRKIAEEKIEHFGATAKWILEPTLR